MPTIQKSELLTKKIDGILYILIFLSVFIVLNFIDMAITIYGLSFAHVREFNDLLYLNYFPIIKLVIIPVLVAILLWNLVKRNPFLAYSSGIWINTMYTMIIVNNFLITMSGSLIRLI